MFFPLSHAMLRRWFFCRGAMNKLHFIQWDIYKNNELSCQKEPSQLTHAQQNNIQCPEGRSRNHNTVHE